MNLLLIAIILLGGSFMLYLVFLAIGFGGIPENRRAQGLDKDLD